MQRIRCATRILPSLLAMLLLASAAVAQKTVSFHTQDGGVIFADLYGTGEKAVVLAHGGRFNKESWKNQAPVLVAAGFQVLALDFRGRGNSHGPDDADLMSPRLYLDVLAAVHYLRQTHPSKALRARSIGLSSWDPRPTNRPAG